MLLELSVHNFALIDSLTLRFDRGLTVFTGETGAGKSLLVDAFGLLLGDRAAASWVGQSGREAVLTGVFDWECSETASPSPQAERLMELGLIDRPGEVVVRRHLARDGRHRVYINDRAATVNVLQEVIAPSVELVGQHASLVLLRPNAIADLLDNTGNYHKTLETMASAAQREKKAADKLSALQSEEEGRQEREAFLRFQVNELQAIELRSGEYEELETKLEAARRGARLEEGVRKALSSVGFGDNDISSRLSSAAEHLSQLTDDAPELEELVERLTSQSNEVRDLISELQHFRVDGPGLSVLDGFEGRHETLRRAFRKHRGDEAELIERLDGFQEELSSLENLDELLANAESELNAAQAQAQEAAEKLHSLRVDTAAALFDKVGGLLNGLGMVNATMSLGEVDKTARPGRYGWRDLPLLFSANAGQPPGPLGKIASGGELSRLVLAFKSVAAEATGVNTCIFDEVDTGIGGGTGEIVGRLLYAMSKKRQVFCVTHLAQIASFADSHFHVTKMSQGQGTVSKWQNLEPEQREIEIARMLSGVDLSAASLENARVLMRNAGKNVDL